MQPEVPSRIGSRSLFGIHPGFLDYSESSFCDSSRSSSGIPKGVPSGDYPEIHSEIHYVILPGKLSFTNFIRDSSIIPSRIHLGTPYKTSPGVTSRVPFIAPSGFSFVITPEVASGIRP